MKAAALALLLAAQPIYAVAAPTPSSGEYSYRTQSRDTLIGLGRKLLKDPRQWQALRTRNGIKNPTRIPVGTAILIPRDWLREQPEAAAVTRVVGAVSADGVAINSGDTVREGARIETAPGAYVTLTLADGSVVTLNAAGTLQLARLRRYEGTGRRDTELKLDRGSLDLNVKPQGEAGRFQIRTPVALSAVRGTEFRRAVDATAAADRTEVIGGAVEVSGSAANAGVQVPAGFGTISDAARGPRPPVKLLPPPDLTALPRRFEDDTIAISFAPIESASGYHAQVAMDPQFQDIVADLTAQLPALSLASLPDSHYWLRIRSQDRDGLEGANAVREFERRRLATSPSLETPRADAFVTGDGVQFRWAAVPGAAAYRFQLSQDRGFSDMTIERERVPDVALALAQLPPGRYFWRLASIDAAGTAGKWSDAQAFSQKHPPPPLAPPSVNSKSFELSWTAEPGQHFELQVASDADFRRLVDVQQLDAPHATLHPGGAGAYFVRVRATDTDGYVGPFTAAQRFTVPLPWWVKFVPLVLAVPFL